VGRLAPEKDQALLVRATARLRSEEVRLVIVGDGPERSRLDATFVHLVGAQSDVPRWLAAFDVFALSSKSEGLPLALIEAMATELPVVATRVGGVGDLVEDSLTGLLVPTGDAPALETALATLERERAWARALGRAGRERVLARHSSERMASEYQSLYEMALAQRRLRRARVRGGGTAS
jgi:glycosyltransferase involved in cell wall biosynthesis